MNWPRPTFLCIGAPKCGTTWLHDGLEAHPDVFVPDFKEVNFFARYEGQQLHDSEAREWFESIFEGTEDYGARGAVSPRNIEHLHIENAAEGMYELLPDCRLICLFRNPVERLQSYYFEVASRKELDYTFSELVEERANEAMLETGLFTRNLKKFVEYYPTDQFQFHLLEDIKSEPETVFDKVCEFIGVDSDVRPDVLHRRSNPASARKSFALYNIRRAIAGFVTRHQLHGLRRLIKRTGLPGFVKSLNSERIEKPELTEKQHDLLVDYYRDDIRELESMIDRDLDHWLQKKVETGQS